MRHVSDDERRARLAVRHALAPGFRVASPEAATGALTVLHATEPVTVHLTCRARVDGLVPADVDRALYADRSLVKQLAMRRTLFVFPRDLLPAVWPSASARVAATERTRLAKLDPGGTAWLDRVCDRVLAALADAPGGLTAAEIRVAAPEADLRVETPQGVWTTTHLLVYLGATGAVVRGTNTAARHVSRPRWTLTRHWLGAPPPAMSGADGYRELIRRWLGSFGPGTEDDIVWWLGSTKAVVRAALAELDAVEVTLDGGHTGWLLPGDLAEPPDPGPWAALLPLLDPTTMGWKHRDFYLGPHRAQLFDRNGNAGTTAWADGRAVGCWTQETDGTVRVHPLESLPAPTRRALDDEATRLTEWLGGFRVPMTYRSPAQTNGPAS